MNEAEIKKVVRESYAKVAKSSGSCCTSSTKDITTGIKNKMGYTSEELKSVPEGALMGLGCGNPTAIASLKKGETVLDLGSGGGIDCFIAADKVGKKGRVIGVDMTPEMINQARENANKGEYKNVEFRLGEIDNLPVANESVDVVISNCVINLVPDKKRVFEEAFRVLRPGGRMMISDIVLRKKLPLEIMNSLSAYVSCVSGASMRDNYIKTIEKAGFRDVKITKETTHPVEIAIYTSEKKKATTKTNLECEKSTKLTDAISSVEVYAEKPRKK